LFLGIPYRILLDRGEAEDLVQEIFLRLCQKSNSFDPTKGSARTWMVQFAYRRSFDRRSYLTRRFFYGGTEIEGLKNTLQEATGLEEQIAARLTGEQLRAAFEELNDKEAATLQLLFFEGCELREVAERLGDSLGP
jgi:RNA polymerase sigma-70 factor (ECF subfamily)